MGKIIAVVQGTADDLYESRDANDYCVGPLLESGIFTDVVIVAPPGEERALEGLASDWGVRAYFGDEWSIVDRITNSMKTSGHTESDTVIARVLLRGFFVDLPAVRDMIRTIQSGFDYVSIGREINYALLADVTTLGGLIKAKDAPNDWEGSADEQAKFRFYPWRLMETQPENYKSAELNHLPLYPRSKVQEIRGRFRALHARSGENKSSVRPSAPFGRYRNLLSYLKPSDNLLDIACGQGGGLAPLRTAVSSILGVDKNQNYIDRAETLNSGFSNVSFICGTETDIPDSMTFSVITSLHTLEHVASPVDFLRTLRAHLVPGGRLLLEVPKLFRFPLGEPLLPVHDFEFSLGEVEDLLEEVGLELVTRRGVDRGTYGEIHQAREAFFYVAQRPL